MEGRKEQGREGGEKKGGGVRERERKRVENHDVFMAASFAFSHSTNSISVSGFTTH